MLRFLNWLTDQVSDSGPSDTGPDGFTYSRNDPLAAEFVRLDGLLRETSGVREWWNIKLSSLKSAERLLADGPDQQLRLLIAAYRRLRWLQSPTMSRPFSTSDDSTWPAILTLRPLMSALLRRKLPFESNSLLALLELAAAPIGAGHVYHDSITGILAAVERFAEQQPLTDEMVHTLHKLQKIREPKMFAFQQETADQRRLRARLDALLGKRRLRELEPGEQWSEAVQQTLSSAGAKVLAWHALVQHAFGITGSKPTKPWLRKASDLIEAVAPKTFVEAITFWFPLVGQPGKPRGLPMMHAVDTSTLLNEGNTDALKGLVWAAGTLSHPAIPRLMGDLAEACFKKIPNRGARCPRVGNACLAVLGKMDAPEAIAQLSRLRLKLKMPSMRRLLDKAVATAGERRGMSAADLEEVSVPAYGLESTGQLRQQFGEFTAFLRITGTDDVALSWTNKLGKTQKGTPANVKINHAAELKELQRSVKDIKKMLPAQAARLERLLAQEREWDLKAWRDRYLDHPLLSGIARRLIWEFLPGSVLGIWDAAQFVDAEDRAVSIGEDARVRLWHPIRAQAEVTFAWRRWLERHKVTQPFKQAHREVYLLTDAETATHVYSNRFAAHIIRQHQFVALCQQRGWRYRLQSTLFDSANIPTLHLPWCDIRAEYWVDAIGGQEDVTGHFISLYVTTDQVRFYRGQGQEPMAMEEVPPQVFTEVMRDVDLFVGVCSIGNDPQWLNRGDQQNFGAYWHDFAFGELNETAKTRKQVLELLLPRLKIGARCSFTDRHLVVRGDRRTYKIHLGSGNILMEPNDQYLCIVKAPARDSSGQVFLPFEGDQTLSIILSKAFMLAEDGKITDPTILRQIE